MSGRASRGKARAPKPVRAPPPEEATTQIETSPELLESLRDESERTTIRLPVRPPFAPAEDAEVAPDAEADQAQPSKRIIVGPDGVARTLDVAELEESTRPYVPSKILLGASKKSRGSCESKPRRGPQRVK